MAEVAVAIVRLKVSALSDRALPTAQDYEICIKEEPSTVKSFGSKHDYNITKRVTVGGHTVGADVFKLPTLSFEPSSVCTVEDLLHDYFKRTGNNIRRAVRIPIHDDLSQPCSSAELHFGHVPGLSLVCVPVFVKESVDVGNSRYENLQRLVNLCRNQPEMLDVHSKNMILILEKWLLDSQLADPHFLSSFFMRDACRARVRHCAHNPAYIEYQEHCIRNLSLSVRSNASSASADLDDRVHTANVAKLAMLHFNKFTISVFNPASNPNDDSGCVYFYEGMKQGSRTQRAASNTSFQDARNRLYPLHKAAEDGNVTEIRRLLKAGVDSNKRDDDSWTPLQYACFHGHIEAATSLLTSPQMTSINAQNKGGATALHFAVINGSGYLVEILTSHASIDVNVRNVEGLRPIDYCTNYPNIREILEMQIYKTKINVDTVIGPFSIKPRSLEEATVGEIIEKLGEETQLNSDQMNCFAIFIYSESMSLQLRPDSLIEEKLKVDKWNSMIRRLVNGCVIVETPKLKLKRNAYATATMEMMTRVDQNSFARATLLDEAINAYLNGHLIANSKEEMAKLAAIVARKVHGRDYKPSSKSLVNIYPQYMLDNHDRSKLAERLKMAMKKNEIRSDSQLEDDFLSMSRGLVTYGASFFDADVFTKKNMGNGQGLVGVNDHGLHIIFKKSWTVKNLRFDEFTAIHTDSTTIEIDAQRSRDAHYILVSTQMKFLKGILQKFQRHS